MERLRDVVSPLRLRDYRTLWIAQVLSELGDWAARLALAVLVLDRTGSATLTGLAVGASLIAWLGPGQLVASAVDRFSRRCVMVGADLVRGGAFLAMLAPVPIWLLLLLAAVAGLATPAFAGARSAMQIEVVPAQTYGPALALGSITQDIGVLGGYALGGLALTVAEPATALGVNALTFLASAAVLCRLPRLGPRSDAPSIAGSTGLGPAVAFLLRDAPVRRAAVLAIASTFSATAAETLIVVFTARDLPGPAWLPAVLLSGTVLVTLGATAWVPFRGDERHLLRVAAWLTLVPAGLVVVLALAGTWTTPAAFLVAGLLFVVNTPTNVVAGPRLPRHLRSLAISVVVGATIGAQAVAATTAGALADLVGTPGAVALVMVPALTVGAWCLLRPLSAAAAKHPLTVGPTQGTRSPTGTSTATVSPGGASGHAHAGSYAHDGL